MSKLKDIKLLTRDKSGKYIPKQKPESFQDSEIAIENGVFVSPPRRKQGGKSQTLKDSNPFLTLNSELGDTAKTSFPVRDNRASHSKIVKLLNFSKNNHEYNLGKKLNINNVSIMDAIVTETGYTVDDPVLDTDDGTNLIQFYEPIVITEDNDYISSLNTW
jgi:hypothetical protein